MTKRENIRLLWLCHRQWIPVIVIMVASFVLGYAVSSIVNQSASDARMQQVSDAVSRMNEAYRDALGAKNHEIEVILRECRKADQ